MTMLHMIFSLICILFEFGIIHANANMMIILLVIIPPSFKFGPIMRKYLLRDYLLLKEQDIVSPISLDLYVREVNILCELDYSKYCTEFGIIFEYIYSNHIKDCEIAFSPT